VYEALNSRQGLILKQCYCTFILNCVPLAVDDPYNINIFRVCLLLMYFVYINNFNLSVFMHWDRSL
jgi:hypothetical protein